jgi:hypothetical protein
MNIIMLPMKDRGLRGTTDLNLRQRDDTLDRPARKMRRILMSDEMKREDGNLGCEQRLSNLIRQQYLIKLVYKEITEFYTSSNDTMSGIPRSSMAEAFSIDKSEVELTVE